MENRENDSEMAEQLAKEVLEEIKGEQGNSISTPEGKLGVIKRVITAETDVAKYFQTLLQGCFDDKQESMLCADAITERLRYGVSLEPILARIYAQSAVKAARVREVLEASSHYSVTQYTGSKDKKGKDHA